MKYDYKEIGKRIAFLRKQKGLSQEDLISELRYKGKGVGRNTISRVENGTLTEISFVDMLNLCQILGCEIGFLIGDYDLYTVDELRLDGSIKAVEKIEISHSKRNRHRNGEFVWHTQGKSRLKIIHNRLQKH